MRQINCKTYMGLEADGEWFRVDEEAKSIVLNGTEYILPDEVWNFLLCIEAERDYYKGKVPVSE